MPIQVNTEQSQKLSQAMIESLTKTSGVDATQLKEVVGKAMEVLAGASLNVTKSDTTGPTGTAERKTTGATNVPSLDNPDDSMQVEANLEKLLAYIQLDNEQRQTDMAKDRIELQKENLDAEHDDRMDQINKSIEKMKDAENASVWSRAFSWIGAIVSVVAAVALTVVTGGAAAGFAIAGAAIAVTSLVLNETGAMDSITKAMADSMMETFNMSKSKAKLAASLILNIGIIAVSAGCSIGGMVAGIGTAASSAAKVGEVAAKAADTASKAANQSTSIFGMSMQTAKTIQNVISVFGMAGATGSLAAGGASTYYTKRSEDAKAETMELEKFITQLQQRLEESEEELQIIIQMIQSGLGEIAQMVGSATDTSSEIANNMGQMA